MIKSWRLKWYKDHQKEVRADLYRGLSEAVLRGETSPATVGKRVVLPSKFVGGARYMIQNYHKWPELLEFLKKQNLKPEDRPDLVSRLFKIKLDNLIKEIKKGKIFGKVKAGSLICITTTLLFQHYDLNNLVLYFDDFIIFIFFQLYIPLSSKSAVYHMLIS